MVAVRHVGGKFTVNSPEVPSAKAPQPQRGCGHSVPARAPDLGHNAVGVVSICKHPRSPSPSKTSGFTRMISVTSSMKQTMPQLLRGISIFLVVLGWSVYSQENLRFLFKDDGTGEAKELLWASKFDGHDSFLPAPE